MYAAMLYMSINTNIHNVLQQSYNPYNPRENNSAVLPIHM